MKEITPSQARCSHGTAQYKYTERIIHARIWFRTSDPVSMRYMTLDYAAIETVIHSNILRILDLELYSYWKGNTNN